MHPLFDTFTFIGHFFSPGQCYFNLDQPALEIHRNRDDRIPLAQALNGQALKFLLVEQKFSGPGRFYFDVSLYPGVGADVAIKKKRLPSDDPDKAVAKINFSFPDRFDLAAAESDAGLKLFEEKKIILGFAVQDG